MGVDADAPDPAGGRYVRGERGRLTGVLHEAAAAEAEAAFSRSVPDLGARFLASARTAIDVLNRRGVTSAQEAATMLGPAEALAALEASQELNARIVLSTPAQPFIEEGVVGAELAERVAALREDLVRPDFVKIVLDGVPTVNPGQALTVEEAVAAFTVGAARAAGIEDGAGRLAPGRPADFAVLDRDLLEIVPEEIHRTTVTRTYFSGRLVHRA